MGGNPIRGEGRQPGRLAGALTLPSPASRRTSIEAVVSGALPLAAVLATGGLLRFAPTFGDFPLGDGGLFLKMVEAVGARGWLPETVSYGGSPMPLAYPPAAFALTAALHGLTGLPILRLMTLLPPLFASATVLGVYLLAMELFRGRLETDRIVRAAALLAALIFAVTPSAYRIIVLGGGLSKAPALFFALLALARVVVMLRDRRAREVPLVALCAGLATLFHPDGALLVTIVSGTLLVVAYRSVRGAVLLAAAGAGAIAIAAVWWLPVVLQQGTAPILSAASVDHDLAGLVPTLLIVPFAGAFPLVPALGWLGIVASARSRLVVLPVLYVAVAALDPRNSQADCAVFASLLGALGALVVVPGLMSWTLRRLHDRSVLPNVRAEVLTPVAGGLMLAIAVAAPLAAPTRFIGPRIPLSAGDRSAMEFASASTPAGARYAVLTGVAWAWDDLSEWFPALGQRESVNTVQGYEWQGVDAWDRRKTISLDLQRCVLYDAAPLACVEGTLAAGGVQVDYLYVAGELSETAAANGQDYAAVLRGEASAASRWRAVYTSPYATIFERR